MIMTPDNPRWDEFCEQLEGPEGCNFTEREPGNINTAQWDCNGDRSKPLACKIMRSMGLTDAEIVESCIWFSENGGHCDCEILFNCQ